MIQFVGRLGSLDRILVNGVDLILGLYIIGNTRAGAPDDPRTNHASNNSEDGVHLSHGGALFDLRGSINGATLTVRQLAPDGEELDRFVVTKPGGSS